MKIYISGKMTGLPDLGREHFNQAAAALQDRGHVVLNPAALPIGMDKADYMPICLAMLGAADAIYMLDGWGSSRGANLEIQYAMYQGKETFFEGNIDSRRKLFETKKEA